MKLQIEWMRPVPLWDGDDEGLAYWVDLERLPRAPGIYIFARKYGKSFEALYVGKASVLRGRIRRQLNNHRLMRHIENAKSGKRVVLVGEVITRPGQQVPKVLSILERAYIRHFLAERHDLVNQQGTKIRRHEIASFGGVPRRFIPSSMFVER